MVRVAVLVLFLVAFALSVLSATAEAGTFRFKPSADAYVNQAHPNWNYGGAKRMWTGGAAGSRRSTFARFDVSGISGTVTRAKLRFYVSNATRNGPAVYKTSASWSESGVTWKARPSTTSQPRGDKGRLARNRWVAWDVTRWVRADGTYSFALKQGAADAAGFLSREAAKAPTLVITTADAPSPPTEPSGAAEPSPIAGQGYRQVFRDDFDTLDHSVWDDHIWYDDQPDPAWTTFQTAESGVLHLRTSRNLFWGSGANDNWPINTITTQTSGKTFAQGYFETRMKWTGAQGAWPGFWLLSYRHATNPFWPSVNPFCAQNGLPVARCWSAELDMFEGQGSEPGVFYGTIHRNSSNDYGVDDEQNDNNYQPQSFDLSADFHTYGMLWTASQITWYLDGQPLMSAPTYDSTNQPMFLLLQMWVGGWTRDPGASTPDVLETQVDSVSVWQK
jgi:beta-glucanase (GH16 family)